MSKVKQKNIKFLKYLIGSITILGILIAILYYVNSYYQKQQVVNTINNVLWDRPDPGTKIETGCKTGETRSNIIMNGKYKATFTCIGEIKNFNIDDINTTKLQLLPNGNILFYTYRKAVLYKPETNKFVLLTNNINKTAKLNRIDEIPSNMKGKFFIQDSFPAFIIFDSTTNKFYKLSKYKMNAYRRFNKNREQFRKNSSLITGFENNTGLYGSECSGYSFNNTIEGCKEIWLEDFNLLKRYAPVKLKEKKELFTTLMLKNGNILLIGGTNFRRIKDKNYKDYYENIVNKLFNTIELYKPKEAIIKVIGNMKKGQEFPQVLLLKENKLLIINEEVLDLNSGEEISGTNSNYTETNHRATYFTMLKNNTILFMSNNCSIFDPQTNKSYDFIKPFTIREYPILLTLKNGKVLIYGGSEPQKIIGSMTILYNSAELFTLEKLD